jgi:hypothetical protein
MDLTESFCSQGIQTESLFVQDPAPVPYIGSWGHYSNDGNMFAASQIYGKLKAESQFVNAFAQVRASRGPG